MKAVCWCGAKGIRVEHVPDPKLINPRDAIIRVTTTCICGSDLHRIRKAEIDPRFVITHRATLDEAPELYRTFRDKQDHCIKVVLHPAA